MFRRVIDLIAEDMVREGWAVVHRGASSEAQIELTRRLNRPYFRERVCQAIKDARIFGGSAIVSDLHDLQSSEMPLDLVALKRVGKLRALDRTWVYPHSASQMFDLIEPEYYVVGPTSHEESRPTSATYKWHESRILRFDGLHLPFTERQQNLGWGASLIDVLYDPWKKVNEIESHIITAVERLSVFIHSINGLQDYARRGQLEVLQKYLEKIHEQLVHTNTLVLDGDIESGQFVSRSISGLDALYSEFKETFTAASGISWSLFWQRAGTGGLSEGGGSELKNWAIRVRAFQENELRHNLERYAQWILHSDDFPYLSEFEDGVIEIKFNNLYPSSEKETQETHVIRATMITNLLSAGLSLEQIAQLEKGASLDSIGDLAAQGESRPSPPESVADAANEESQHWYQQRGITTLDDLELAVQSGAEILPETYEQIFRSAEPE